MAKQKGRPPINDRDDIEAIQKKIDAYFEKCKMSEERPTFTGLALALGYCDRSTLWKTATAGNPISQPVKRAMLMIEQKYELMLGSPACTGSIFALKNRGWVDKQDIAMTGNLSVKRDYSKLTDAQLEELEKLTKKIDVADPDA